MPIKLPFTLPGASKFPAGGSTATVSDQNTGGYDFMIDGHGFRLATDQNFPYIRMTEPTTTRRFDSSLEPGEQTLNQLPWVKSQSSFHAGAGQLNLEQGFTAFQYQQEQVEHIRFDASLGVDVWTPGQVKRLPDSRFYGFTFTKPCMITATISGTDYAIIGDTGHLYQVAWASGPDADPVITGIDLSGVAFGGASNCAITSLCSDGNNYYALVQLTNVTNTNGIKTYIVTGSITSVSAPTVLYLIPASAGFGSPGTRTNLCVNPDFETGVTEWAVDHAGDLTQSTTQAFSGTHSGKFAPVSTGTRMLYQPTTPLNVAPGSTYTASFWIYIQSGPMLQIQGGYTRTGVFTIESNTTPTGVPTGAWTRVSYTWTVDSSALTTDQLYFVLNPNTGTGVYYIDDVLIEQTPIVRSYFSGNTAADSQYVYTWSGTANDSQSVATPVSQIAQVPGVIGWSKARLVGGLGNSVYELPTAGGTLPAPKYTNPAINFTCTAISESPDGVLVAGDVGGNQSSVVKLTLNTAGAVPTLSGGNTITQFPPGEYVTEMENYLGSFVAIATNRGIHIGTFDTYSGTFKNGPLSVTTTNPCLALCGRDRFVYGGYTNQQQDGRTGLVRIDLSYTTDEAGRLAYAADLRPSSAAPTGQGIVYGIGILSTHNRLVYVTPEGLHVEGGSPGSDGTSWLRTSRIRYDTAELKLFTLGRVHGTLDVGTIQVEGIAPFQDNTNLGTFGFIQNGDPGEFNLVNGTHEWMQLQFTLVGSATVFNSYQVKAIPAPKRQHIITLTANCFHHESNRWGQEVVDPETPRQRYQNILDIETAGNEVRFVEFEPTGPVATLVVVEDTQFQQMSRPSPIDYLGGYLTIKMRATRE